MSTDINSLSSIGWSNAETLRGDFKQYQYGKVLLPLVAPKRISLTAPTLTITVRLERQIRRAAMKRAFGLVAALCLSVVSHTALAQDFEKGLTAYYSGNFATALKEWMPLAESGNAQAQFQLGVMYSFGWAPRNYAEAARWYRLAAEQGDAGAQSNLGRMYAKGEGVPQDLSEAVRWFTLAANQGYSFAQLSLAYMYEHGMGVRRDYAEAVRWYRLLAEQGNTDILAGDAQTAQHKLGLMYANGKGVPQNDAGAVRWYRLSAKKGFAPAQNDLGLMYVKGEGVQQDDVLAYMWFNLAAASGHISASANRDTVAEKISPEQRVEAQRMSSACLESGYTNCGY